MSRISSSAVMGGPQSGMHMQPVQSSPMLSGPLNIPGSVPSGINHPFHGMPMTGAHDREHLMAASAPGPIPAHYFQAVGVNPNSPHHISNISPHRHHQFHHPHPILSMNRIPPFFGQPELRIFEMNKRLQQREDCDSIWWEAFATDFFEDDATLTIGFQSEDGFKRYSIGRTLIPRYFRSIFESGCVELFYNLRLNHEYFHPPCLTLDSEAATMTMNIMRGIPATVVVEGRLTLEFSLDELSRIRSWIFVMDSCREMIVRNMLGIHDPQVLEQLTKNVTRYGMTPTTLNFFRLCVILEPMQELMSRQKAYNLTPRDCLKTTLFQKWQRMMPQETTRQPSKRRKRKGSAAVSEGNTNSSGRASKRKQSPVPIPPHHLAQPGDVMIVGEPTLMGGDFGDDDERLITRLENTQYDAIAAGIVPASSHMHPNFPAGPNDPPSNLISTSLNSIPYSLSGPQFRSGPGSHSELNNSNDPMLPSSLNSIPSYQAMSMPMGSGPQPPVTPNRFNPHCAQVMASQQYMQSMPVKSTSRSTPPISREPYPPSMPYPTGEPLRPMVRSNSNSSLPPEVSGFPSCQSPNKPLSRPPTRFTPPHMPNGLIPSTSSSSLSQNFISPGELIGSQQAPPMSGGGGSCLSSPIQTSFTPEPMDTMNMHPSSLISQAPPSTSTGMVKPSNSPTHFGCPNSSTNGPPVKPETTLSSMLTNSGCDPLPAISLNEPEDAKLMNTHYSRSHSEPV